MWRIEQNQKEVYGRSIKVLHIKFGGFYNHKV
jgi:hypothetical protein